MTDYLLMTLRQKLVLCQQALPVGEEYVHACGKVGMGSGGTVHSEGTVRSEDELLKDKVSEIETAGGG